MDILTAAIVGLILPPVVSFLKTKTWPVRLKFLLSIGVSFAAVAIAGAIQGDWNSWEAFIQDASVTFATSQIAYMLYFGNTDWNESLENIGVLPGPKAPE